MRAELAAALRRAERLVRQLLAELRVVPHERSGGRRKAGGQAAQH